MHLAVRYISLLGAYFLPIEIISVCAERHVSTMFWNLNVHCFWGNVICLY